MCFAKFQLEIDIMSLKSILFKVLCKKAQLLKLIQEKRRTISAKAGLEFDAWSDRNQFKGLAVFELFNIFPISFFFEK